MIRTWKQCREKYALRYVDGLVPAKTAKAPSFGTLFHLLMKHLWIHDRSGFSFTDVIDEWREPIIADAKRHAEQVQQQLGFTDDRIVDTAIERCDNIQNECLPLFQFYRDDVWQSELGKYTPIFVERTFEVPLTTRDDKRHPVWRYSGKWDLVLWENATQKTIVRDYKTTVRNPTDFAAISENDTQHIGYTYASLYLATHKQQQSDEPFWPERIRPITDYELEIIRKKVPKEPPLLKRGGLSKAQNIDTTQELYMQAIKRHGLEPSDYQDVLDMLEKRGPAFHFRHRLPVGRAELLRWAHETRVCLEDLRRIELHRELAYRADSMTCRQMYGRRCEYHSLCYGDADAARVDFIVRKPHEELDD